jgi:hypothetical protein
MAQLAVPETEEQMELLRQDPVRCKIIVNNNRLNKHSILNISVLKFAIRTKKDIQQKLAEFAQILEILNNTITLNLV